MTNCTFKINSPVLHLSLCQNLCVSDKESQSVRVDLPEEEHTLLCKYMYKVCEAWPLRGVRT